MSNLQGAKLEGANLEGANLEGAQNLSLYQLSKVKTLHAAKLDEELSIPLKASILLFLEKLNEFFLRHTIMNISLL